MAARARQKVMVQWQVTCTTAPATPAFRGRGQNRLRIQQSVFG